MKEKINTLKDKLNKELENKNLCDQEVIKISQELDQLILEYYYNNDNILPDNDNSS
ncbi:aspartyl-phosphate phosphatase Spo0E family protein [Paratissierella segnis]|uniref:Aspartyl-phosphate phosphatase Spo0E family protein n=1 Tax=Paratissierella segnis TaxID=2763679 RepID=A0A926ETR4_9FIRM|nr:aspartyl-phosphate phosphatase Spo0E family protein [Paratissierella segnis]MBC8587327.1 aspartyl-phosphate phosphatase Spo0E family protein [Paratissierella segnis]